MAEQNHRLVLESRPQGTVRKDDFQSEHVDIPPLEDGQVLVGTTYISLDPAMRGWLRDVPSYIPPVQIGEVMRAGAVGEVLASRSAQFAEGDHVTGALGWQTHAVMPAKELRTIDTSLAEPQTYLGALGMPGMTAYFGLLEVGALEKGDRVLVSAAAGAVGSLVGQIAKLRGCHVVGIAGGEAKCALVKDELGLDDCIDYKGDPDMASAIKRACPEGIDVYFDNVGGEILDAALRRLRRHARIVICGAISQYNEEAPPRGPSNYLSLLVHRARMEGFVVFDYVPRYPEAIREMAGWIKSGELEVREQIEEGGLDRAVEVMNLLFTGGNTGKLLLKVR